MLLGRGHLICKCTVTGGRLLSLVPNLDLDSKQRGQYFNLHLHLKLFKGWQPPSYSFTSFLSPFFLQLSLLFSRRILLLRRYLSPYSTAFYNIHFFKNVSLIYFQLGYIINILFFYIERRMNLFSSAEMYRFILKIIHTENFLIIVVSKIMVGIGQHCSKIFMYFLWFNIFYCAYFIF